MNTPKSDAAIEQWDRFTKTVRQRLENGKETYGDSSFEKPMLAVIEEIRQECEDQAGWAFIAWTRLNELEQKIVGTPVETES